MKIKTQNLTHTLSSLFLAAGMAAIISGCSSMHDNDANHNSMNNGMDNSNMMNTNGMMNTNSMPKTGMNGTMPPQ